ncbi:hypothetical protein TG4357_03310 [Thalassovita gelatinovora]|uniref:DUF6950 domain-containing protein n=1 Tax=Thalassovita gelatinovora TaxID=53501 RepID=A0A0P1FJG0_THAGE|nr:hypothetical protein [Thalassovita gelatinovora]QIZ81556.1 hypothetical protein HFZ77_14245 [Thalassovita gelatinovora]CUH67963.1 hypothetical protein TG4357_03310 [Thalassovita gelatinovora]SEQ26432.1 hypothetical protein SAMN04488043_104181 [Thalassovita gelatinovora]
MRYPDWNSRLIKYLSTAVETPFQPGIHDCALFFAGAVEAQTGKDHAAPYRGRYTTLRGGLRVLRKDGFGDHIALAAHHLPEIPPSFAQPGDGAVIDTPDGPALGVVQGERIYVLGIDRLHLMPRLNATRAFGVR